MKKLKPRGVLERRYGEMKLSPINDKEISM
jgi:hypothetical protein